MGLRGGVDVECRGLRGERSAGRKDKNRKKDNRFHGGSIPYLFSFICLLVILEDALRQVAALQGLGRKLPPVCGFNLGQNRVSAECENMVKYAATDILTGE